MSLLEKELVSGVAAAFGGLPVDPPRVELGTYVKRPHESRRSPQHPFCDVATLETTIGDESIALALVVEGYGGPTMSQWCLRHMLPTFVRLAGKDPSGRQFQKAGRETFRHAHDAARDVAASGHSGCTATLCAINRHRREVTTCNVGALAAVLVSRGRISTLTSDHALGNSASERERMRHLRLKLAHADDRNGKPIGPLRVWPAGLTTARAIGFLGAGEAIDPMPSCSTMALPLAAGSDVVIGSRGVWDELLSSTVAGIVRATPIAAATAKLVVEQSATASKSYAQNPSEGEYEEPAVDTACVILSLVSLRGAPRRMSYLEARNANQKTSPRPSPQPPRSLLGSSSHKFGVGPFTVAATPLITPGSLSPPYATTPAESTSPRSVSPTTAPDTAAERSTSPIGVVRRRTGSSPTGPVDEVTAAVENVSVLIDAGSAKGRPVEMPDLSDLTTDLATDLTGVGPHARIKVAKPLDRQKRLSTGSNTPGSSTPADSPKLPVQLPSASAPLPPPIDTPQALLVAQPAAQASVAPSLDQSGIAGALPPSRPASATERMPWWQKVLLGFPQTKAATTK